MLSNVNSEMAMPQRDNAIEAIKRLDLLLEHAVMHNDEAEAERIRAELRKLTEEIRGRNEVQTIDEVKVHCRFAGEAARRDASPHRSLLRKCSEYSGFKV